MGPPIEYPAPTFPPTCLREQPRRLRFLFLRELSLILLLKVFFYSVTSSEGFTAGFAWPNRAVGERGVAELTID